MWIRSSGTADGARLIGLVRKAHAKSSEKATRKREKYEGQSKAAARKRLKARCYHAAVL